MMKKIHVNEEVSTEKEVKEVLRTFKDNKSAGTDVKTEGLKYNNSQHLINVIMLQQIIEDSPLDRI